MIDFKEAKKLEYALKALDQEMQDLMSASVSQPEAVKAAADRLLMKQAVHSLSRVSVDELAQAKASIRVGALKSAGFTDLGQLHAASDSELAGIKGIGQAQVTAIRDLLAKFCDQLSKNETIRLDGADSSPDHLALVLKLDQCLKGDALREESKALADQLHVFVEDVSGRLKIRNRFRWLFSGAGAKETTLRAFMEMKAFFETPLFIRVSRLVASWQEIRGQSEDAALHDFREKAADFYALLESLAGSRMPRQLIYSSIPAQLAASIDAAPLDLTGFSGHLRAYQTFGVKYILTQKRVLLGDEMGLGKTIQAIGAMVHLENEAPGRHFLVVCPASVLVNWCREIRKFSPIRPCLIHGAGWEAALAQWQKGGGAAVTNYEMMEKLADHIDGKMRLAMLIIDEAHYIKNPDAKRTKNIRCLDEESERILLMTGTPLENHVEEMCSLIDFIRPDMADEVRQNAYAAHIAGFREMLAPLYLRRLREHVLSELPSVEYEIEWCSMTDADRAFYAAAVMDRNFQAMRRISFLQEDMGSSAKALRLLELTTQAAEEKRKVIVYSFFRETVSKMAALLGSRCVGVITGSLPPAERQQVIDRFTQAPEGSVLVCQVQAGGTGLNIQTASVVIFCEPQIKPSLTNQAVSRVYRMGQSRNVLVFHLLCEGTVDEAVMERTALKQETFDAYAAVSSAAEAEAELADHEWIADIIEKERQKYLPAIL